MTKQELEKTIESLGQTVAQLKESINIFQVNQNKKLEESLEDFKKMKTSVEKTPLRLEDALINGAAQAIQKSALDYFSKAVYPFFNEMSEVVLSKYRKEVGEYFDEVMTETLSKVDFKKNLQDAFSKRIAKTIVAMETANIDKVAQNLKNDIGFKAKLTVIINDLVNDYSKK